MDKNIKVAIQKSGRLREDSLKLLEDAGITINNGKDHLKTIATGFPMEILYLRNGDIPQYLRDGVVDLAIIGSNTLLEKGNDLPTLAPLGFSKCRVSLAVPKSFSFKSLKDIEGKRIATSYPNTVYRFFKEQKLKKPDLHIINGSVEIAPNIGLADGICDIVSSGSTLFRNNLKEVVKMVDSEAVLTSSPQLSATNKSLLKELQFRIDAVLMGRNHKYILLNAPNDQIEAISNILPSMRSPTILPLAKEGWCAIHAVIKKNEFWESIDALKKAGAEGILVSDIEKMVC